MRTWKNPLIDVSIGFCFESKCFRNEEYLHHKYQKVLARSRSLVSFRLRKGDGRSTYKASTLFGKTNFVDFLADDMMEFLWGSGEQRDGMM